ncbi:MAG: hypothetical protein ACI4SB_02295 [Acutalibacteraceae bacterium]
MKRKAISVILTVTLLLGALMTPASAAFDKQAVTNFFRDALTKTVAFVMESATKVLNLSLKDNAVAVKESDFTLTDFYSGNDEILSEPAAGAGWSLGYSSESLVPENWQDYDLYLGGFMNEKNFFSNDVREIYDDMKVRTIALSDNSGRGISVFATIDSIGMTNTDIRAIRALLADFAKSNNINSINIFATHCHSCIDTQGLWTKTLLRLPMNIAGAMLGAENLTQGTDPEYMKFLSEKVKKSIETAVNSMEKGEMTFAQKDLGEEYFYNKNRTTATALMTYLTRFAFYPYNKSVAPTIIANMAAHPDIVGLAVDGDSAKGHALSGDYVYYIGETLNKAGYNFMFFNGAICGIYIGREPSLDGIEPERRVEISQRYGREIGKILLAMTKTLDEIKKDEFLMSTTDTAEQMASEDYTLWYENWQPVEEVAVKPLLNVRIKSVRVNVTNNVIISAGKARLVNHTMIKDNDGKYYISTEIGFVQIGDQKIAMVPGELSQDLVVGGASLTAEGSINHTDFTEKTISEIFGEDVLVFGLANDAIGYIVPDNDYAMGLLFDHYQESLSLGKNTASFLMQQFEELNAEIS